MLGKSSLFRFVMEIMFGRDPRQKKQEFKNKPFRAAMKLLIVLMAASAPKFYSSYHSYYSAYNTVIEKYRNEKKVTEKLTAENERLREDVSALTRALVKQNNNQAASGKPDVEMKLPETTITKKTIKNIPVDKSDVHKPVRKPEEMIYDRKQFLIESLKGESNEKENPNSVNRNPVGGLSSTDTPTSN